MEQKRKKNKINMLFFTGALTSKPYAFTSRPWELKSVQSIDIFDGLGSNIRVDFKETEIVRILPRKNVDINESWISDKIRFFYDGLNRQRISNPYIKINGELKPTKWAKTLQRLISSLKVVSLEYGPTKVGILVGSSIETEALFLLRELSFNQGFSLLGIDKNLSINLDNPSNYKFNSSIADLEKKDYFLVIGTNPRYEASILGLRLRKHFKKGGVQIQGIGGNFSSNFGINFLGTSGKTLSCFFEGKHQACKYLAKAKNPCILLGSNIFKRYDALGIQNMLKYILSYYNSCNKPLTVDILQTESNIVGAYELGLNSYKKDDISSKKFVYALGVDDSSSFSILNKNLSSVIFVYQNCTGNKYTINADVILPSTSFIETSGLFFNTEGRPQRTQRAFIGPQLSRDNWKICFMLFSLLKKTLPYFTKPQLNTRISKIIPNYDLSDTLFDRKIFLSSLNFNFESLAYEKVYNVPFKLFIEDFFMTHSLCKSSRIMAKASESLRSYSNNYKFLSCLK